MNQSLAVWTSVLAVGLAVAAPIAADAALYECRGVEYLKDPGAGRYTQVASLKASFPAGEQVDLEQRYDISVDPLLDPKGSCKGMALLGILEPTPYQHAMAGMPPWVDRVESLLDLEAGAPFGRWKLNPLGGKDSVVFEKEIKGAPSEVRTVKLARILAEKFKGGTPLEGQPGLRAYLRAAIRVPGKPRLRKLKESGTDALVLIESSGRDSFVEHVVTLPRSEMTKPKDRVREEKTMDSWASLERLFKLNGEPYLVIVEYKLDGAGEVIYPRISKDVQGARIEARILKFTGEAAGVDPKRPEDPKNPAEKPPEDKKFQETQEKIQREFDPERLDRQLEE